MELSTTRQATSYAENRKFPKIVMESEDSTSHLQELSTCEADQSSTHHIILSLQYQSHYYTPTYNLIFLLVSLFLAFPQITYTISSSTVQSTGSAQTILLGLFILIILAENYR
jgi:hypothetical protein